MGEVLTETAVPTEPSGQHQPGRAVPQVDEKRKNDVQNALLTP